MSSTPRNMLVYLKDPANLLTLSGLFCGVLGLYFAAQGIFFAAMIAMLWAVFFDWFDGPVARRTKGRGSDFGAFGAQFDSLSDLVSAGLCPALVLLSYGNFSAWYLPGAFLVTSAIAIRLSNFNAFGFADESHYLGVTTDLNIIFIAFLFLLEGFVERELFSTLLYGEIIVLSILNVAPLRFPKLGGVWYYIISVIVISLSAFFAWRLMG